MKRRGEEAPFFFFIAYVWVSDRGGGGGRASIFPVEEEKKIMVHFAYPLSTFGPVMWRGKGGRSGNVKEKEKAPFVLSLPRNKKGEGGERTGHIFSLTKPLSAQHTTEKRGREGREGEVIIPLPIPFKN